MNIQDILNSNLSDSHKLEVIALLQRGGNIESKEKPKKTITPTDSIKIGGYEYDVVIADTPESRKKGLEDYNYLREDEGMLFIFDAPTTDYFTMKNCGIDLDIIFIDSEMEVVDMKSVKAYDPKPVTSSEPYQYVLEININSDIEEGDELELEEEDEEINSSRMLVLDSNGDVQMKLVGGERIFSRISTKRIIKAALKAYKEDTDLAYRKVGRIVLKELDAQDSRPQEYTEIK